MKITNKRQVRIVIGAAIILTGIILWYFLYFIKTPVYSLNQAREAIQAHDTVKFEEHIDLDAVLAAAYDDFTDITVMNTIDKKDKEVENFAKQFISVLKRPTVKLVKSSMLDEIAGKERAKDEKPKDVADFAKNLNVDNINHDTGWKSVKFKGVEYCNITDNVAIVGIKISQEGIGDMVLDVRMDKMDGVWKAVEIVNLKDYLQKELEANNKVLASMPKE